MSRTNQRYLRVALVVRSVVGFFRYWLPAISPLYTLFECPGWQPGPSCQPARLDWALAFCTQPGCQPAHSKRVYSGLKSRSQKRKKPTTEFTTRATSCTFLFFLFFELHRVPPASPVTSGSENRFLRKKIQKYKHRNFSGKSNFRKLRVSWHTLAIKASSGYVYTGRNWTGHGTMVP